MEITISSRHFTLTETTRQRMSDSIQAAFADLPLKIMSAQAVLDMAENKRAKVSLVINIKDHIATAEVEDFDLFKALDSAISKTFTQATKLIDKRKTGKQGERLADAEQSSGPEEE